MLNFSKSVLSFLVIPLCFFILISCSKDNSTESSQPNETGISASDFAFNVGNEWNYNGTGYNAAGSVVSKSISTSKLRIISETNSNGLNGYKLYATFKNWLGVTKGEGEDFFSTENNGLWTLEKLANGSTSPTKILPFGVNNATIRSETYNKQMYLYYWYPPYNYYIENITMDINIKFEFLGSENINVSAGSFNNCKKINVMIDISQRSDTSGVELFNNKTWYIESLWWLSTNNGLIKTQNSFNCVVDSIVSSVEWDPNSGKYVFIYESILESSLSYQDLRYFDVEDLMIPVSAPWYKTKVSGLTYLGKYINELNSKNF